MALPSSGKPTASQVADWAISVIGKRIDVDGYYGAQCWDLPSYITKRYWGWTSPGHAKAFSYNSLPSGFKRYRNTVNFVPKPGDFAVWTGGSFSAYGHVAIVISATKTRFVSIDQNWFNANMYNGSPAARVAHNYSNVTHFVRPPYKAETTKPTKPNTPTTKPKNDVVTKNKPNQKEIKTKVVVIKKTKATIKAVGDFNENFTQINHRMIEEGTKHSIPIKGVYIKNDLRMPNVSDIYNYYMDNRESKPDAHYYIDRDVVWEAVNPEIKLNKDGYIVISICESMSAIDDIFIVNELAGMVKIMRLFNKYSIKLNTTSIQLDESIYRSLKVHSKQDLLNGGINSANARLQLKNNLIKLWKEKDKIYKGKDSEVTKVTEKKVVVKVEENKIAKPPSVKPSKPTTSKKPSQTITNSKSSYTLTQALNKQMGLHGALPQVSNGNRWVNASRTATLNALNPNNIKNDATQKYQFLDLGKFQGIPVDKLNQLLRGKGKLQNQGKAFSEGAKRAGINEIYLIVHAILETGHGKSSLASGGSGYFNMFGIGAYDSNPYSGGVSYARSKGWNTPYKAIVGGAQFIGKDYIKAGQNTLYRMRWNPKRPGVHQYATDIRWAKTQASQIKYYYNIIKQRGKYFIIDNYK